MGYGSGLLIRPTSVFTPGNSTQTKPLKCSTVKTSVYYTATISDQIIDIKEDEAICDLDQDICVGILSLFAANFTHIINGQKVQQELFQLNLEKGCARRTGFKEKLEKTYKIQDANVTKVCQKSTVGSSSNSGVFRLGSFEAFGVPYDRLLDGKVQLKLAPLRWQIQVCSCDWSMCNGTPAKVTLKAAILIVALTASTFIQYFYYLY